MKEIMCVENNFSASQIRKVHAVIADYYFEGGYLYFNVPMEFILS